MVRVLSKSKNSDEFNMSLVYIKQAADEARRSPCAIKKKGAVVVNGEDVVGRGYNGPNLTWGPWEKSVCAAKASCPYDRGKGHCIGLHAELRAILDTPKELRKDAIVYYARVDESENLTDKDRCIVASRSICGPDRKACADCAPKLREVGIREIAIIVEVCGGEPTMIHMCPIDEYYFVAFSHRPPEL